MLSKVKIMLGGGLIAGWLVLSGGLAGSVTPPSVQAAGSPQTKSASTQNPSSLPVLKSKSTTLKGAEKHRYQIVIQANDYLNLVVDQQGIDVVVRLFQPDGKLVQEVDSPNGMFGPEPIYVILDRAGTYVLEIESLEKEAQSGKYEVVLDPVHSATEQDRVLIEVQRLQSEARIGMRTGKNDLALTAAQRGMELAKKSGGADSILCANGLEVLGKVYVAKGDYDQAEVHLAKSIETYDKVLKNDDLRSTSCMIELANLYVIKNQIERAESLFQRCLALREKVLGPDHPEVGDALSWLGSVYIGQADYSKAEPLLVRSLAINEKTVGDSQKTALSLIGLGVMHHLRGEYEKARPYYERSLAVTEKIVGPEHPSTLQALGNLAFLSMQQGDYLNAESYFLRVISIQEKNLGPIHPDLAITLSNLGQLYITMANYDQAEARYQRSLAINEKIMGPTHPWVALTLNGLAQLQVEKGEYPKAEKFCQQALAINEKAYGPTHPEVAANLNNLGDLYRRMSNFSAAEPLYRRAVMIWEKALGSDHPNVASGLSNQGTLYLEMGNLDQAEACYRKALAIQEKKLGPNHSQVGLLLGNIAKVLTRKGDYAASRQLQEQALAIREKALGPDHPEIASSCGDLGIALTYLGTYDLAEAMFTRALTIYQKKFGPGHRGVALSFKNLGLLHRIQGNFTRAEEFYRKALALQVENLGSSHIETVTCLGALALVQQGLGHLDQAVDSQFQFSEACERNLAHNLVVGSERQKALFINSTADYADATVSLHLNAAPQNPAAAKLALTEVLRRKGRALEVMTSSLATLRRQTDPETQKLLDDYAALTNQISILTLKGPGTLPVEKHRAYLNQLTARQEQLEADLTRRSAEFAVTTNSITIDAVRAMIPDQAVLVEFTVYHPFNPKANRFEPAHYGVYVLTHQGDIRGVDLGETGPIDAAIAQFRKAVRNTQMKVGSSRNLAKVKQNQLVTETVMAWARQVDRLVLEPVRAFIGTRKHLVISPDGDLNLIPFAALVTESGKFLVEDSLITYVTSGRDLLRMQVKIPNQQPALIVADPDYAEGKGPTLGGRVMKPLMLLPGTRREGKDIQNLMLGSRLVTQGAATKEVVQQTHRPEILHIATHGYFLEATTRDRSEAGTRVLERFEFQEENPITIQNPLLRSWLFFAGANREESTEKSAIMTALEASQLDLWGTKLVVLSACDTGVGEVKNGNGVYGLRRALVLAGSESQMMSLWSVSDVGTRELMVEYYTRLKAGEGRSEALRNTQLKMLKDPRRQHPFYWASFIQSGEWKKL